MSYVMASSCVLLPILLLPLIAFDKSWISSTIRSSVVSVGCVMCLCLKYTVSEIRFALAALKKKNGICSGPGTS